LSILGPFACYGNGLPYFTETANVKNITLGAGTIIIRYGEPPSDTHHSTDTHSDDEDV